MCTGVILHLSHQCRITKALPPLHWRQLLIITVMASTNYSTRRIALMTAKHNVTCTLFQETCCNFSSSPQSKKSLITILVLIKKNAYTTIHNIRRQYETLHKSPRPITAKIATCDQLTVRSYEGGGWGDNMNYPCREIDELNISTRKNSSLPTNS